MNQHGIKDPKDFSRQKGQVERLKELVPQFGERARSLKQNTDFLDAIMKGIEQATRAMEAQRQREKQRTTPRGKRKYKQNELDVEQSL